jgi:hypothetical protein
VTEFGKDLRAIDPSDDESTALEAFVAEWGGAGGEPVRPVAAIDGVVRWL